MLNLHSWVVLQETEAGKSDVKHYSLPVEQPLSAAVAPADEVRQGSTTGCPQVLAVTLICLFHYEE